MPTFSPINFMSKVKGEKCLKLEAKTSVASTASMYVCYTLVIAILSITQRLFIFWEIEI